MPSLIDKIREDIKGEPFDDFPEALKKDRELLIQLVERVYRCGRQDAVKEMVEFLRNLTKN